MFCLRVIVHCAYKIYKKTQICTDLKNAWWGMSDAERGTSDADGSMAFCRGKAWL